MLYEALVGKKAFPGDDASDALAAVIRAEPDFEALPSETPSSIRRVLRRCLTKNARERLADIADARLEIAEVGTLDEGLSTIEPTIWKQPKLLVLGVSLVVLGWLAGRNSSTTSAPDATVTRYVVTLPETDMLNMTTGGLAVSPDGQRLAYVATRNGVKQLFVRERDQVDAVPIPGSENAASPFFSPDGQWLAFSTGRSLMKASLAGGAPQRICDAKFTRGASWGDDGTNIFGDSTPVRALSVPAAGGIPKALESKGAHFPFFLPAASPFC